MFANEVRESAKRSGTPVAAQIRGMKLMAAQTWFAQIWRVMDPHIKARYHTLSDVAWKRKVAVPPAETSSGFEAYCDASLPALVRKNPDYTSEELGTLVHDHWVALPNALKTQFNCLNPQFPDERAPDDG